MIRLVALSGAVLAAAATLASAAPPPRTAETGSSAYIVRISIPDQEGVSLGSVTWPTSTNAEVQSFQYPADGSIVSLGRSRTEISSQPGEAAVSQSFAEAIVLSLFGGEVTAAQVTASVSAGASARSAGFSTSGSGVQGLRALDQDVPTTPGSTATLADWGSLSVLSEDTGSRRANPPGAQASVVALRVRLSAEHGGLPAGSEIVVGSAQAVAVAELPPAPRPGAAPRPAPTPAPPGPSFPIAPEPESAGDSGMNVINVAAAPIATSGAASPIARLIARITPVMMPGVAAGSTWCQTVCQRVAPSAYEA